MDAGDPEVVSARTCSIVRGMPLKESWLERKAATAISSAALRAMQWFWEAAAAS